jgi:hypothetical protein
VNSECFLLMSNGTTAAMRPLAKSIASHSDSDSAESHLPFRRKGLGLRGPFASLPSPLPDTCVLLGGPAGQPIETRVHSWNPVSYSLQAVLRGSVILRLSLFVFARFRLHGSPLFFPLVARLPIFHCWSLRLSFFRTHHSRFEGFGLVMK